VQDKLVDVFLQGGQIPSAATDAFNFLGRGAFTQIIAVRLEIGTLRLDVRPVRIGEGAEAAFHTIGIVAAGVQPEDDLGAGVEELSGDDNLIAFARFQTARARGAAGQAYQ
jgi:hypothetical protein